MTLQLPYQIDNLFYTIGLLVVSYNSLRKNPNYWDVKLFAIPSNDYYYVIIQRLKFVSTAKIICISILKNSLNLLIYKGIAMVYLKMIAFFTSFWPFPNISLIVRQLLIETKRVGEELKNRAINSKVSMLIWLKMVSRLVFYSITWRKCSLMKAIEFKSRHLMNRMRI